MAGLKRTPLHAAHERRGAKLVEFAGFSMPVSYTSIQAEHAAVREAAGLFDVSHMGQIGFDGPEAVAAAEHLSTRAISPLAPGAIRYGMICNESGGVLDDVTVYRLAASALFFVVNASNVEKIYRWAVRHSPPEAGVRNTSEQTAMLALQGPASAEVLTRVGGSEAKRMRRFRFDRMTLAGCETLVSRTGYTGSDGYEIYAGAGDGERLFETLLAEGDPLGLVPAGLGARDTLRLEAALPLYGHELDETTTPFEAGLGRFVDLDGRRFIGSDALATAQAAEPSRRLVGFELDERGIARAGHPVMREGEEVGVVTSGGPSPTLGKSIGLAYVPPDLAATGSRFDVSIRGRATAAHVVDTPFV